MAKKAISIVVNDDTDFEYGQKLYVIKCDKHRNMRIFKDKCPVCRGTHKIEYNGYSLRCPQCEDRYQKEIMVRNYIVAEYVLNGFKIIPSDAIACQGGEASSADEALPSIVWHGYSSLSYEPLEVEKLRFNKNSLDERDLDTIDIRTNQSGAAFRDKESAQKFCEQLHNRQRKALEEFNEKYGTAHEYPFQY